MKARKLTLAERLLGVTIIDHNDRRDMYSQTATTVDHIHGSEVTYTCTKIANGWIVSRSANHPHYVENNPTHVSFYPDVVSMAEGIKTLEALMKLTSSKTPYDDKYAVTTASGSSI